jgi:hypothetical protein
MERRTLLGAVGGAALSTVAAVDLFAPGLIVGSPQAEGEPISTEQTTFEGTVDYRPESDTVRSSWQESPDDPDDYTTESFEKWASGRADGAAADAAGAVLRERVDGEIGPFTTSNSYEYLGWVVNLRLVTLRKRDGEVREPKITLETLVDAAPKHVEVTVRLSGRSHTERIPVFVDETTMTG